MIAARERRVRPLGFVCVAGVAVLLLVPAATRGALLPGQRTVLTRYLSAVQAQRYTDAFALLSDDERAYFGTAANFASAYWADKVRIRSYRLVASERGSKGTLVYVLERVEYYEYAHRATVSLQAKVAYAVVASPGGPRVKDPSHPWRALAPVGLTATAGNVRVAVEKISFFTGRMEAVATFANVGDAVVTLLPYGRSLLRDDSGNAYAPIRSKLAVLTDRTLYGGLRLAPNARYTGLISFTTPNRFRPKAISFVFAPALRDGGDAPFEIALPPFALTGTH